MQEPIIYNCKENDSRLKVVIEDGKIGEIWIEDPTHKEQWLVVGFQDLKNAIKEAEATMVPPEPDNTINLSEWSVAYAANDQKISVMLWPIKPYMENPFIIVPGKDGSLQKKPLPKTCGIIEPIIEIHNPEPKFIPMQVCPVCAGEGRITSKSTSAMFQECPLCKGQRAIPMAKA